MSTYSLDGFSGHFHIQIGSASIQENQEILTAIQGKSLMSWTKSKKFGNHSEIANPAIILISTYSVDGFSGHFHIQIGSASIQEIKKF